MLRTGFNELARFGQKHMERVDRESPQIDIHKPSEENSAATGMFQMLQNSNIDGSMNKKILQSG